MKITEKCVGPMKLMMPLVLYGRMSTDSFSVIQSGNGASVCDDDISLESESLLVVVLVFVCVWYNVCSVCSLMDVLKMFWLLSSSNKIIFLFSSLCCWGVTESFVIVLSPVVFSDCEFKWSSVGGLMDDGVSFKNGLKRFCPLPGVNGVVVICFGGDEPARSKSIG